MDLGFPLGIRLTHWFSVLLVTLLMRSGLAILAAHPKLYWNIHAWPGTEWLRLHRKELPKDRLWCSTDEEASWPGWLTLPGGDGLGLGRYWHFASALLWLICGACYLGVMFTSDQWRRLTPTSWEIVPCAWRTFVAYLRLESPEPHPPFNYDPALPFNALQQLTYFGVIYVLTPFQIITGLAQSPSLLGRFPWFERLFGNRQAARSLHFLGLLAFAGFTVIHLAMVFWHDFATEMDKMALGRTEPNGSWLGIGVGLAIVAGIALVHLGANVASRRAKRFVHIALEAPVGTVRRLLLHRLYSVQQYPAEKRSPYFRANGYPPISAYPQAKGDDDLYERLLADGFRDYRLEIGGLVEQPLRFSLAELRAMPKQEQSTMHHCIQGWTSIGCWGGVRISEILDRCRLAPEARYLVFQSFGMHEKTGKPYYECVDLRIGMHPQAILAYELNGVVLPIQHGAPLRPRFETKLGFKMVKYLRSIEVVENYRRIGRGMGGVREDEQQYDKGAQI